MPYNQQKRPVGIAILACLILTSCASQKVLQATGGSRADGTVELSFDTGMFETPVIDWNQANAVALKRCQAWGYTEAEAFGGSRTQCQAYNAYGNCLRAFVTIPYQCTNAATAAPLTAIDPSSSPAPNYVAQQPAPISAPPDVTPVHNAPTPEYAAPSVTGTAVPASTRAYAPSSTGRDNPDPYAIDP